MRRQEKVPANIPQSCFPNQFNRSPLPAQAPCSDIQFWKPLYHPHAGFQGPLNFRPEHVVFSPRNLPPFTRAETPCPCCPVQSNRFPADDMVTPNNAEDKRYQLRHFKSESPGFLDRLPRLPSNQFRKTSEEQQQSRDYKPQSLMGTRKSGK